MLLRPWNPNFQEAKIHQSGSLPLLVYSASSGPPLIDASSSDSSHNPERKIILTQTYHRSSGHECRWDPSSLLRYWHTLTCGTLLNTSCRPCMEIPFSSSSSTLKVYDRDGFMDFVRRRSRLFPSRSLTLISGNLVDVSASPPASFFARSLDWQAGRLLFI